MKCNSDILLIKYKWIFLMLFIQKGSYLNIPYYDGKQHNLQTMKLHNITHKKHIFSYNNPVILFVNYLISERSN